ncbi:MAG: hypothetical protein GY797_27945 [Deltaproteobacteria bacterium]|nr:hypothetical protein [Deltaproteobacteria bacterium]
MLNQEEKVKGHTAYIGAILEIVKERGSFVVKNYDSDLWHLEQILQILSDNYNNQNPGDSKSRA